MKVLLILFLFVQTIWILPAQEQVIVCSTCTYSTVEEGLRAVRPGGTLIIEAGTYYENQLVVDKKITIKGQGNAVIDGSGEGEVLTVIADGVVIEGLTIQHVGTSYIEDRAAIRIKKSDDFVIRNNRILDAFFGIYLENASDGLIMNNTILGKAVEETSSGNAIHMWYCKRIRVAHNTVSFHRDGIYLEFVDHSEIHHNQSHHNLRYGLHFMFSNYDNYHDNVFEQNGAGVAVMFSKFIEMRNNVFNRNWGKSSYGLLLKEIYDGNIYNNIFSNNTIGIYVEGSTRIIYQDNLFERNGWAMKISGGCLDTELRYNDFVSNTFDLSISQNISENTFDHNYWSAYSGYDLDRNGTGDVPYRPVKLFNFVVNQTPEAMILLRSLFIDLVNFAEKVSPIFTPENVVDRFPSMQMNRICQQ